MLLFGIGVLVGGLFFGVIGVLYGICSGCKAGFDLGKRL
jgi:hypothetical protein